MMKAMLRPRRPGGRPSGRPRLVAVLTSAALVASACAAASDGTPGTAPRSTSASVVTLPPPSTDLPPEITTTSAPPNTAPQPATTELVITTLAPTTTTEPLEIRELLLRGDSIGSAVFGAAPEGVIDYISSILGQSTADTLWVDPLTFAVCDGTIARKVEWGVLSLLFSDLSTFADGRRHFMGYEYGLEGQIGDLPTGLRTPGGTTIGSRIVDLAVDFPEASVNPAETDPNVSANFYVSDNFHGLVTGTNDDDVVLAINGGYACGE
jgi:hypothetical protein